MTKDQHTRVQEALVAQIERAETPEAVIKLTELLMNFQRQAPVADD